MIPAEFFQKHDSLPSVTIGRQICLHGHVNKVDRFVYTVRMKSENVGLTAREKILLTAHDLFYQEGIGATGIDRIIKESGVTKVTFYRHYPSKNELIRAYLEHRHANWMNWFVDAVDRHRRIDGDPILVIVKVLAEWFESQAFRGCAFINAVAEFDGELPGLADIIRRHKADMKNALALQLQSTRLEGLEMAVAMAIDGAIVRAQIEKNPEQALQTLKEILSALQK